MTSQQLKVHTMFYLLYRAKYAAVFSEYGGKGVSGIADLFGINDKGFTCEFEIKVAKQDLDGELNSIEYLLKEHNNREKGLFVERVAAEKPSTFRKGHKHQQYLRNVWNLSASWGPQLDEFYRRQTPSKFSFVVPENLSEYAQKRLIGTPYGLICIHDSDEGSTIKKAEYLHKIPCSDEIKMNLLSKAAMEVQTLRQKQLTI